MIARYGLPTVAYSTSIVWSLNCVALTEFHLRLNKQVTREIEQV